MALAGVEAGGKALTLVCVCGLFLSLLELTPLFLCFHLVLCQAGILEQQLLLSVMLSEPVVDIHCVEPRLQTFLPW